MHVWLALPLPTLITDAAVKDLGNDLLLIAAGLAAVLSSAWCAGVRHTATSMSLLSVLSCLWLSVLLLSILPRLLLTVLAGLVLTILLSTVGTCSCASRSVSRSLTRVGGLVGLRGGTIGRRGGATIG